MLDKLLSFGLDIVRKDLENRPNREHARFIEIRERIRDNRAKLIQNALTYYNLDANGLLLVPENYDFKPIPLEDFQLDFQSSHEETEKLINKYTRMFRGLWPGGNRLYSDAIRAVENPSPERFYNGRSYRLLKIDNQGATLSPARYFDFINTGEALVFSDARDPSLAACSGHRAQFPRYLNLEKYVFIPGVQTVSIRVDRKKGETHFYMLHRNPKKVATEGEFACLLPAGELQPATRYNDMAGDLDLWLNIMRESVEEFLGQDIHQNVNEPFRYDIDPFPQLRQAREEGKIKVWLLGYGANPLNFKLDFLTACVYESEVFDHIFKDMVEGNHEGDIIKANPFNYQGISHFMGISRSSLTSITCLDLAYKWKDLMAIPHNDEPNRELNIQARIY